MDPALEIQTDPLPKSGIRAGQCMIGLRVPTEYAKRQQEELNAEPFPLRKAGQSFFNILSISQFELAVD